MSVRITMPDVLEPVVIEGDFNEFIGNLNLAATQGKQYVICQEPPDSSPIALETRSIRIIRPVSEEDELAFIGG